VGRRKEEKERKRKSPAGPPAEIFSLPFPRHFYDPSRERIEKKGIEKGEKGTGKCPFPIVLSSFPL